MLGISLTKHQRSSHQMIRSRASACKAMSTSWWDAYVLVDEAERDAYRKVVSKARLLVHPGLTTLSAIRNNMLDQVKSDVLVTADDDVVNLKAMVGWYARSKPDPDVVRDVLQVTAQCALDAGCSLFGFNQNSNSQHYKPFDPIKLVGWVGSVFGFVGDHGLRFDERLVCDGITTLKLTSRGARSGSARPR